MSAGVHGYQEEEALGKAYDARLMRRLLTYVRPYRPTVALAVLLLAVQAGLVVVAPWLTQQAIDVAIPARDRDFLATLSLVFIGITLVTFIVEYAQALLTTWLGQRIMYDLRTEIFGHLQQLDLRFYDKNPTGRLMTRATSDVETLNDLFSSGIVTVFGDIFSLAFIVGAMVLLDVRLAVVTFSVLPFVFLTAFFFRTRIRQAYRDIRVRLARINAYLHERITGMQVVQLFNREARDLETFGRVNEDYLKAHLRSITYYALFFPAIELFTSVALALIIWYGGGSILQGTLTVGVVAAFIQYARRFFRPIQDLSEKYNLLQAAMASSERVFKLLDTKPAIDDPRIPQALPEPVRGSIEFRNVWFAYGDDENGDPDWVLRDVSFTAEPGEKVAIVGHTGAGKTTVINLLMRFYEPQKGAILLDGIPIDQVRLKDLRDRIGLVLQDVFLFSQDIAFNIRLGDDDITDERVRRAAERVDADRFIQKLPAAYGQELGERGSSLSVGERQLVSFARALAFDPPILVLDEATSSVDSEIEAQIDRATTEVMKGRTSLVIAHRLSTVQGADRILVFHHGRLCEEGTHTELLQQGGLYARLHELQFVSRSAA